MKRDAEIEREVEKIFAPVIREEPKPVAPKSEEPKAEKPKGRLKQTGAEYNGLIGYNVDNRRITLWADGTEIEPEEFEELIAEIRQMIREHKRFKEMS